MWIEMSALSNSNQQTKVSSGSCAQVDDGKAVIGTASRKPGTYAVAAPESVVMSSHYTSNNSISLQQEGADVNMAAREQPTACSFTMSDAYLKTLPGVLRVMHLIGSFVTLLFVVTCGNDHIDYLSLSYSSRLRLLVFVCVFGLLLSLFIICVHVCSYHHALPIKWHLVDLCLYSPLAFLLIVAASLVANVLVMQQQQQQQQQQQMLSEVTSSWTTQQLICATVFGYVTSVLCVIIVIISVRMSRARSQHNNVATNKFSLTQQRSCETTSAENPFV